MRVVDLMNRTARSCHLDGSLNDAARIMWEDRAGAVPVVDGEARVVGIVTDRDAAMGAYTTGRPLSAIRVVEAMARRVVTCRGPDGVAAAERLMWEHQVRRLPVVDDGGRLVGMLELDDIARPVQPQPGGLSESAFQPPKPRAAGLSACGRTVAP